MRVHRIETEQMILERVSFLRFRAHACRPRVADASHTRQASETQRLRDRSCSLCL
jgi:hypothetical protein